MNNYHANNGDDWVEATYPVINTVLFFMSYVVANTDCIGPMPYLFVNTFLSQVLFINDECEGDDNLWGK